MDGLHELQHEPFGKIEARALFHAILDNLLPAVRLEGGYVLLGFEPPHLLHNIHPLTEEFEQAAVELVDVFAQFAYAVDERGAVALLVRKPKVSNL